MSFLSKFTLEERSNESQRIMNKYPNRLPVIVEKAPSCLLEDIDKNKFLVCEDMKLSEFIFIIRKRIHLESSQSLFITINGKLCQSNTLFSEIYKNEKNEDGFIYIIYTTENTFG